MSGNEEFAREWLRKAGNDLITARQTLLLPDGPTDTVCFHAQQAVEKSLKGLLTYHGISFQKIHNLLVLLDLLLDSINDLVALREQFALLNGYSVEARYPGDYVEPTRNEAQEAVKVAEKVLEIAWEKMR
ncbi:MAG: HEPN domain-containing [Geobacteraceae bacterium]|nr:MAG: HEPN domain-containing [Geobacteraceae bacterium]